MAKREDVSKAFGRWGTGGRCGVWMDQNPGAKAGRGRIPAVEAAGIHSSRAGGGSGGGSDCRVQGHSKGQSRIKRPQEAHRFFPVFRTYRSG